ncbi:MAG: plasmid pRiA4b ORF-3 family protein, partial [Treponema sp.]|nr:plasmid pRiA4b ORF-3 family protein [Treponema sp.]
MDRKTHSEYPRQTYELRVSVADIRPRIWRKLSVPGNYTLGDLHAILQIAFGWDNVHMHSFTIDSMEYGMIGTDFGFSEEDDVTDEDTVRLYD